MADITYCANKEDYLVDVKQCKICEYWRAVNGFQKGFSFCHHLLDTGKRREQENGVCLSQKRREQ